MFYYDTVWNLKMHWSKIPYNFYSCLNHNIADFLCRFFRDCYDAYLNIKSLNYCSQLINMKYRLVVNLYTHNVEGCVESCDYIKLIICETLIAQQGAAQTSRTHQNYFI